MMLFLHHARSAVQEYPIYDKSDETKNLGEQKQKSKIVTDNLQMQYSSNLSRKLNGNPCVKSIFFTFS